MNKKRIIVSMISITLSIVAIILISTVFAPCKSGMICKKTTTGAVMLFSANIILAVMAAFAELKRLRTEIRFISRIWRILEIIILSVQAVIMVINMFVDVIFGGCKKADMACRALTFPTIHVVSALCLLCILYLVGNAVFEMISEKRGNK